MHGKWHKRRINKSDQLTDSTDTLICVYVCVWYELFVLQLKSLVRELVVVQRFCV